MAAASSDLPIPRTDTDALIVALIEEVRGLRALLDQRLPAAPVEPPAAPEADPPAAAPAPKPRRK